jgi:hypothetical protein
MLIFVQIIAPPEGTFPNFHEAFTQLHLGQLIASVKCMRGDRRDGGIDPNTDHIVRNFISSSSSIDEDIGVVHFLDEDLKMREGGEATRSFQ